MASSLKDTPLYLSNWALDDVDSGGSAGTTLNTGVLRRKYNFGDQVSELAIAQTPFFRLVSKISKKPTDDPQFKFTERRPSFHKRYSYVVGMHTAAAADGNTTGDATIDANDDFLFMATDYQSGGNIQNVYGQSSGAIAVGSSSATLSTAPEYFLNKQIVKVPMSSTDEGGTTALTGVVDVDDYMLYKVTTATDAIAKGWLCHSADSGATNGSGTAGAGVAGDFSAALTGSPDYAKWYHCTRIPVEIIKSCVASFAELANWESNAPVTAVYGQEIAGTLEKMRSYVVGTAHEEGSQLINQTWNDQPFSTGYGQTQIFRTEFGMTNTARATILKYEPNEWARIWRDKLIEHKWEIEQSAMFSAQGSTGSGTGTTYYTQGAVDFILNNGNIFALDQTTKTQDDFLDDLSNFLDPRYNNAAATLFFCDTSTYNWLHKLSGYFANNVVNVVPGGYNGTPANANYSAGRSDFAASGRKNLFGVDFTTIATVYGNMNVARNIHLDGTAIKMLGINMKYCSYRPLVGNGVNRDTSVYVGVQSLENTGTDKRVDMILTEGGFEWQMPEAHAVWK